MPSLTKTIEERDSSHGPYDGTAAVSQTLKDALRASRNWREGKLTAVQRESLELIAHKMARIAHGNPNHADSWHDIAGYATLAERECAAPRMTATEVLSRTHNDGEVRAGVLGKRFVPLCPGPLTPET